MNISRLSTFSLTLAIAVLTLGFTTPSLAGKPVCPGTHPSCKDDPDPPPPPPATVVYEAELTIGGFIFGPVDVTPSKRGNSYHSQDNVDMSRPLVDSSPDQDAWDSVFETCPELLSDENGDILIDGVIAGDSWTINISGSKLDGSVSNNPDSDILIRFRDVVAEVVDGTTVEFLDADIDFNLIGEIGFTVDASTGLETVTNFLPEEVDDISVFDLVEFNFFASGNRGGGCRSGVDDLFSKSVLEITRTK